MSWGKGDIQVGLGLVPLGVLTASECPGEHSGTLVPSRDFPASELKCFLSELLQLGVVNGQQQI